MRESHGIIIREAYKDWSPPVRARQTVDRLLNVVPKKRLAGLKTIVITNSANLSHDQRNGKTRARGRKVSIVRCGGLYHEKWNDQPAWVQLFLDNIIDLWPKWSLRVPLLRDFALSEPLFHELGHHIHSTQAPQHKEPEDVADAWQKKLSRHYFRKQYWYLMPLFFVLWLVVTPVRWVIEKRKKANNTPEDIGANRAESSA